MLHKDARNLLRKAYVITVILIVLKICFSENLEFPNDRLAELKDISHEIVRAFEDERADAEDTVDTALEYLVCCSEIFSKKRQKLRQRLIGKKISYFKVYNSFEQSKIPLLSELTTRLIANFPHKI